MSAALSESALAIRTNASKTPVEPSARNHRVAGAATAGELWPPRLAPFAQYIDRSTTMGWPLVLSTTAETAAALARPGTVFTFSVYRLVALHREGVLDGRDAALPQVGDCDVGVGGVRVADEDFFLEIAPVAPSARYHLSWGGGVCDAAADAVATTRRNAATATRRTNRRDVHSCEENGRPCWSNATTLLRGGARGQLSLGATEPMGLFFGPGRTGRGSGSGRFMRSFRPTDC